MDWAYTPLDIAVLGAAVFLAGLVRGFSGFGTAMIYLPVAGQVLPPFAALTTLVIFDLLGPLPNVPRAMRDSDPVDLLRLMAGLVIALPAGLYTLTLVAPEIFRYAVSIIALCLLACLISGFRYRGQVTPPLVFATGGAAGFLQGVAGVPGPPVILFYMASAHPVTVIRANTFLFLMGTDVVLIAMLALFGRLEAAAMLLGGLLILPNMIGNLLGARMFRPERARTYRAVAYAIIAALAITGLPVWD